MKFLALACLLSFVACRQRNFHAAESLSTASLKPHANFVQKDEGDLLSIYGGLASPRESAPRAQGVAMLQAWIDGMYTSLAQQQGGALTEDQEVLRASLHRSVKAFVGPRCRDDEKVRVFRGIGAAPLLRPAGAPWTAGALPQESYAARLRQTAVASRERRLFTLPAGDLGQQIFALFAAAREPSPLAQFRREAGVGDREFFLTSFGASEKNPADYRAVSMRHSGNSDAKVSPFLSMSLSRDIALKWAPAFLVADLCPERLVLAGTPMYYVEEEFYAPFAIAPEEMVAVDGLEEALAHPDAELTMDQISTLVGQHAEPQGLGHALHQCFDRQSVMEEAIRFFVDSTKDSIAKKEDAAAWRLRWKALADTCAAAPRVGNPEPAG